MYGRGLNHLFKFFDHDSELREAICCNENYRDQFLAVEEVEKFKAGDEFDVENSSMPTHHLIFAGSNNPDFLIYVIENHLKLTTLRPDTRWIFCKHDDVMRVFYKNFEAFCENSKAPPVNLFWQNSKLNSDIASTAGKFERGVKKSEDLSEILEAPQVSINAL